MLEVVVDGLSFEEPKISCVDVTLGEQCPIKTSEVYYYGGPRKICIREKFSPCWRQPTRLSTTKRSVKHLTFFSAGGWTVWIIETDLACSLGRSRERAVRVNGKKPTNTPPKGDRQFIFFITTVTFSHLTAGWLQYHLHHHQVGALGHHLLLEWLRLHRDIALPSIRKSQSLRRRKKNGSGRSATGSARRERAVSSRHRRLICHRSI